MQYRNRGATATPLLFRKGKRGRPPVWKLPEMKVALLGAVQSKREEWKRTRHPSDRELVRRLQAQGAFLRWKETTLLTELSRAWRWFWSEAGTIWFEQEQARWESEAVNLRSNPAAPDPEEVV